MTKVNQTKVWTITVFVLLACASFSLAAPVGSEITAVGPSYTATDSNSETFTITGGNISEVNILGRLVTGRWAGLFGNATGQIFMGDNSLATYFEWTTLDMTNAYVYATSGPVTDWTNANIQAASSVLMPAYLQVLATDSFSSTFPQTDLFLSTTISEPNTPYMRTWQNGAEGALRTYALYSPADGELIWAGNVIDDTTSFQGGSVDYQIIVPADAGGETYNLYLEMP